MNVLKAQVPPAISAPDTGRREKRKGRKQEEVLLNIQGLRNPGPPATEQVWEGIGESGAGSECQEPEEDHNPEPGWESKDSNPDMR